MAILPGAQIIELFDEYSSTRSLRKKSTGFIKLVEASSYKHQLTKKAIGGLATLKNCGETHYRRMPNGIIKDYIFKCHHPVCHKCDAYDREQYAYDKLDEVRKHFDHSELVPASLSSCTINFSKSELGSDLTKQKKNAMSLMNKLIQRKMPDVVFIGGFQNAMQRGTNGNEYTGMFHAHFVAIHPTKSRTELTSEFTNVFDGKNQVCVNPFKRDKIDYNVCVFLYYSADLTTRVDSPGKNEFEVFEYPDVYARYLNSLESIRSGKRRGWTFEIGHRRNLKKKHEEREKEWEHKRILLRKRMSRIRPSHVNEFHQSDDVSDSHECQKFECIHKQLRDTTCIPLITSSNRFFLGILTDTVTLVQNQRLSLFRLIDRKVEHVARQLQRHLKSWFRLPVLFHRRE